MGKNLTSKNDELSRKQLEILQNRDFLLTKNEVIHTVTNIFENAENQLKTDLSDNIFLRKKGLKWKQSKVSKGNNYQGLPFVVLDSYVYNEKNDLFMYRGIMLWGLYFTHVLIAKGGVFEPEIDLFWEKRADTDDSEYWIGQENSLWQHEIKYSDYSPHNNAKRTPGMLKLAKKTPLNDYSNFADNHVQFLNSINNLFI